MSPHPRTPFRFHAGGHAFSARFTRPVVHDIDTLASVCLPTIGGRGHAHVDDFAAPCLVRIKRAHTCASGSFSDEGTASTQVTATLEGLNIADFLTADLIVSRLTSEHAFRKQDPSTKAWDKTGDPEGHILALGSEFKNLRIGGYPFNITLRQDLLIKHRTHAELAKTVAPTGNSGTIAGTQGKVIACSLVEKIETKFPGLENLPAGTNVVEIPHFGTITFAELVFQEGVKTLTMLEFHLGSPTAGLGTGGQTTLNGTQEPPPVKGGGH